MPEIKLSPLPDRRQIKVTVTVSPDLHHRLEAYAAFYAENYGREEPVSELIPAMIGAFLDSDRAFSRRKSGS